MRLSRVPVKKLSTHRTSCPRARSSSQRWLPRKPAPPVTNTRLRTRSRISCRGLVFGAVATGRIVRSAMSIRLRAPQSEQRHQDDIEIETHRPVLDVVEIVLDAHVHLPELVRLAAPAADLRPSGD